MLELSPASMQCSHGATVKLCRVHKPGVPHGLASQQRLGPADDVRTTHKLLGQPKYLNDRLEG